MSELRSYHQFLGNGIDAVLLGPLGCMSPEAAQGLDRCYWYKADTYYADDRQFKEGDDPVAFHSLPPGGTVFQLAPLARAWYELVDERGAVLHPHGADQRVDAETGVLRTTVLLDGGVTLAIETSLAADLPALHFSVEASEEISLVAFVAPGTWPEDREWVQSTSEHAPLDEELPGWQYRVGTHQCALRLLPAGGHWRGRRQRHPRSVGASARSPPGLVGGARMYAVSSGAPGLAAAPRVARAAQA